MREQVTTLCETIPQIQLTMSGTKAWSMVPFSNGWFDIGRLNIQTIGNDRYFAYQTEIDVSGWGNQGLSFFPMQAGVQEGGQYQYLIDDTLQVIDVISDSPLDVAAYVSTNLQVYPMITLPALNQARPSTNEETVNPPLGWENILYGNSRTFQHNDNLQGLLVLPVQSNEFGSMNPTASDKLYITRIVKCGTGVTTQVAGLANIPPTRFIIKGQLKSESDLSYIYRLKDSFKTTQTDVGYNGL
jgi:hypothetical protein